jgi:hypothetical protein
MVMPDSTMQASATPATTDSPPIAAGVLALELAPGSGLACDALAQAEAGALAELLARDLGALVELDGVPADGMRTLDLVFAAAHFDPAEVLRPGWPLHRRLDELHRRAPRAPGARVIAFGADRDGAVPQPLRCEEELRGGQLRVLPFLLAGEADSVRATAARLEAVLLDRGMVQADTALYAQQAFGARIEHARYFTVHDLAAMTALQYRNQGLEALWTVIETALLAPGHDSELDAPPEPLLRYAEGEARIALFPPDAWRRYIAQGEADPEKLERGYERFQARQRQFATVLRAHGIEVTFAHCNEPTEL